MKMIFAFIGHKAHPEGYLNASCGLANSKRSRIEAFLSFSMPAFQIALRLERPLGAPPDRPHFMSLHEISFGQLVDGHPAEPSVRESLQQRISSE